MSLDESGMAGVLSANKPIDAEFCRRVGMVEDETDCYSHPDHEIISVTNGVVSFCIADEDSPATYRIEFPVINTQGRFLHLLQALGIEVPG